MLDAEGRRIAGDEPLARLPLKLKRGQRHLFDGALDGRAVRIAAAWEQTVALGGAFGEISVERA